MRIYNVLLVCALVAMQSGALLAQTLDPRTISYASCWYQVLDAAGVIVERGDVRADRDDAGGFAKFEWSIHKAGPSEVTVDLPFHYVGSLQRLAEDTYLVSGQKQVGTQLVGVLTLATCLRTPTQSIQLSNTQTYANLDHYRVVWNALDQKLYSLDWASRSFLVAPWGGSGAYPATFTTILTGTSMPFPLADYWESAWATVGVTGFRVRYVKIFPPAWVRFENGAWTYTYDPKVRRGPEKIWALDSFAAVPTGGQARQADGQILPGPNQILIAGPQGPVSLLDENGLPHGQYNLAASWQYQAFQVPAIFNDIPGLPYRLSNIGTGVADLWFRPNVRYGVVVQGSLIVLNKARSWPESCTIGNAEYKVTQSYDLVTAATQDLNLTKHLWIGFRAADGTDPVDLVGSTAILRPDIVDSKSFTIRKDADMGAISHLTPIANDPSLVGIVMLYQWVIPNPDGSVSHSQVFGTSILPADSGGAQKSSSKGGTTRLQISTSAWGRAKPKEKALLLSKAKAVIAASLGKTASFKAKSWVRDYEVLRKIMIKQARGKKK